MFPTSNTHFLSKQLLEKTRVHRLHPRKNKLKTFHPQELRLRSYMTNRTRLPLSVYLLRERFSVF